MGLAGVRSLQPCERFHDLDLLRRTLRGRKRGPIPVRHGDESLIEPSAEPGFERVEVDIAYQDIGPNAGDSGVEDRAGVGVQRAHRASS